MRAGLLVQKQVITGPIVHFGLGDQPRSDVVRIVWPNGTVQGEFDTKADQDVVAEQRLKGSCPFLFAFDGTGDAIRDRLHLAVAAGPADQRPGHRRRRRRPRTGSRSAATSSSPREGYYDLRITAELWETHYWDHVSLMVVDHPRDTEVFVDERFARQPPPLAVHPTGPLHPVAYARDDHGPRRDRDRSAPATADTWTPSAAASTRG